MSTDHMDSPADLPAQLTFYETAKLALAEARTVDETKKIRDHAERIAFAARQAKDRDIIADATEIQSRAERRLGELLIEAKNAGQLHKGGRPSKRAEQAAEAAAEKVSLEEAGISRKLSSKAQKLAEFPADQFESVLKSNREKIKAGTMVVVNPGKDLTTQDKQLRRAIREHELAARQKALPDEIFGLIMEDPEWQFDTWSELGQDRAADNHYPTSTLEALKARSVAKLAAADCVYFLWATAPMLPQALELMAARGFAYKTHFIWDKVVAGTGYWNRNRHELLLVGVRGSVPAPAMGTQWESVVASPKGVHSAKPDWAYELCEHYYPSLKKIELNARRLRSGWTAWGYEAPEDDNEESLTKATTGNAATDGDQDMTVATTAGRESQVGSAGGRVPDATSETDVTGGESAASEGVQVAPGDESRANATASEPSLADPIRQDDPADAAVDGPQPFDGGRDLVAATPETDGAPSTDPGAGEGAGEKPGALPYSDVDADKLTKDQQNEIIKAGYALEPKASITELMLATGLKRSTVKMRAIALGLADPENQKAAVRRLMQGINERRAGA